MQVYPISSKESIQHIPRPRHPLRYPGTQHVT